MLEQRKSPNVTVLPTAPRSWPRAGTGVVLGLSILVASGCAGVRLETGMELHTDARLAPAVGPPAPIVSRSSTEGNRSPVPGDGGVAASYAARTQPPVGESRNPGAVPFNPQPDDGVSLEAGWLHPGPDHRRTGVSTREGAAGEMKEDRPSDEDDAA